MKIKNHLLNIVAGVSCFAGFASASPTNYVAHEWGTFTSVQGADGAQMVWNPLSVADLPSFVYDWQKTTPAAARNAKISFGKDVTYSLQRMETPVIYFYSDHELTLNAEVKFPMGTMTEWYPRAILPLAKEMVNPTSLRWENIRVFPTSDREPATSLTSLMPPNDKGGSHYYAARETDADLLQVGGEVEKFLFYRGIGNFRAPLTVTQSGDEVETVTLQNTGRDELRHLFIYQVNDSGGRFVYVPALPAGKSKPVKIGSSVQYRSPATARDSLSEELAKALVREGLYEREAKAMVKTWDDSWLGEKGVRVLYALSGRWTDQTLPLTLNPKPAEVVRVMVGRAELITPKMEWDLMREIVRYGGGTAEEKAKAVAATRALGLGRFLEPAVRRLTTQIPSGMLARHSSELLTAASKPEAAGKRLAAK